MLRAAAQHLHQAVQPGRRGELLQGDRVALGVGNGQAPVGVLVPGAREVLRAAVAVLTAWGWEQRPGGVVMMSTSRRPALVASTAERIAAIGRLPLLGRLDRRGGEGASRVNSAQRVRALHTAIAVGPDLARALANCRGAPVLLVDDYADTGWTLALAARALRRAGSGPVLPFVLAVAR